MSEQPPITRRAAAPAQARRRKASLDLNDPHDNCKALIKLQADLSGREAIGVFPGEAWAWIPGEGNRRIFRTLGLGVSRVEFSAAENAYRFYHREALVYLDPDTGAVLESWRNPWTERTVEVLHILNDHVNRLYQLEGGPFPFPWAYETNGDDLVFRISVFRFADSVMKRREYPLHSQSDKYQTTEMWGMIGRLAEVQDPDVTSAGCVTSWSRISGWQPVMEMGNMPGQTVFHSHSYKLRRGMADLDSVMPRDVRAWFDRNAPQYFEAPREWTPPSQSIGVWNYSTPFSWPRT
jgi:hypothetical protein